MTPNEKAVLSAARNWAHCQEQVNNMEIVGTLPNWMIEGGRSEEADLLDDLKEAARKYYQG